MGARIVMQLYLVSKQHSGILLVEASDDNTEWTL